MDAVCYEALESIDFRYESIENHPKVLILQGFYGSGRRSRKFEFAAQSDACLQDGGKPTNLHAEREYLVTSAT